MAGIADIGGSFRSRYCRGLIAALSRGIMHRGTGNTIRAHRDSARHFVMDDMTAKLAEWGARRAIGEDD